MAGLWKPCTVILNVIIHRLGMGDSVLMQVIPQYGSELGLSYEYDVVPKVDEMHDLAILIFCRIQQIVDGGVVSDLDVQQKVNVDGSWCCVVELRHA